MVSLFVAVPITVNAATYDVFTYAIENGEVTIIGCDESASGDIEIPATIEGYPVTTIGDKAFVFCENLTSITIPDGVTRIENSAFSYCYRLTNINIPDGVRSIGEHAFSWCISLSEITIPDSVTTIGACAFFNTALSSIHIPAGVTSIGGGIIPQFSALVNITVDENNPNYCSDDGILFTKDKTQIVQYPAGKSDSSYIIPDSVTIIGDKAFGMCNNLTDITIPSSVTTICDCAFYWCENLKEINIPHGVTTIGKNAFQDCTKATKISIPVTVTSIGDFAFGALRNLTDIYYGGTEEDWNNINFVGEIMPDKYAENIAFHFKSLGDADGDGEISVKDVILLRRFLTGSSAVTITEATADVYRNGRIDVKDIITLRRFIAGGYGVEL